MSLFLLVQRESSCTLGSAIISQGRERWRHWRREEGLSICRVCEREMEEIKLLLLHAIEEME